MKQRTAILLALGLTVFVLVVTGAIVMSIQTKNSVQVANSEGTQLDVKGVGVEVGLGPTLEPTLPSLTQLPSPTHAATGAKVALAAPTLLSADRGKRVALTFVPGSTSKQLPELVNYKGKMAYEVVLDIAIVYVDAFNAKVLGSVSTIVTETPPADTGSSSDNGGGNDGGGASYDNSSAPQNDPNSNPPPSSDTPQDPAPPPQDDHGNGDQGGDDHSGDNHGSEDNHGNENQSGKKGHHKGENQGGEDQEQGDEGQSN